MDCPHEPCTCTTVDGGFCGDHCRRAAVAETPGSSCACGHDECLGAEMPSVDDLGAAPPL